MKRGIRFWGSFVFYVAAFIGSVVLLIYGLLGGRF